MLQSPSSFFPVNLGNDLRCSLAQHSMQRREMRNTCRRPKYLGARTFFYLSCAMSAVPRNFITFLSIPLVRGQCMQCASIAACSSFVRELTKKLSQKPCVDNLVCSQTRKQYEDKLGGHMLVIRSGLLFLEEPSLLSLDTRKKRK